MQAEYRVGPLQSEEQLRQGMVAVQSELETSLESHRVNLAELQGMMPDLYHPLNPHWLCLRSAHHKPLLSSNVLLMVSKTVTLLTN